MRLSVIIPAYNEEARILPTLMSVFAYLKQQKYDYEVLVVNDGSDDHTPDMVRRFADKFPELKLIDSHRNYGKAHAVRRGMLKATGELRLFMDADNSTTIDNLEKFEPYVEKGFDVVIASIGLRGSVVAGHEPAYRRWLGKAGNLWIQMWAVPGIKDTQRGFKLFTQKATERIFPQIRTLGWGFDVEALALARLYGYKIKEVPVHWKNGPNSKVNLWAYPRVLLQTLVIFWNIVAGKYK